MNHTRADLAEQLEEYSYIIRKQSQIIDKLFLMLLEHVEAEELDRAEILKEINALAAFKEN